MAINDAAAAVINGIGVGRGAAVGPVVRAHPAPMPLLSAATPRDPARAADELRDVFAAVGYDLDEAASGATGPLAAVLQATASMARDPQLVGQATDRVRAGESPAGAVSGVVDEFSTMFTAAGGYLAERVTDLMSVRHRVIARLEHAPAPGVPPLAGPSVVVATDLAPADTAQLDLSQVLAIVVEEGGPTSHTAIVAAQLGLPCVVRATGASALRDGQTVAVDAAAGTVELDPSEATRQRLAARTEALTALAEDRRPGATSDGHAVQLLANIGTPEDAERLTSAAVEGVGLFRTELVYLGRKTAPSEQEQVATYARVLAALAGRKVVVRTLDAGADKPLAFFPHPAEDNPALGMRGYRTRRIDPDLLSVQLRSLATAADQTDAHPWVMAPMVSTVAEATEFAGLARAAGIQTVGVMVEVPAVALRAPAVLAEVDFVSIGTNDLAQYTMATDRLRGELADLLDPWQPAVLDLVAATAAAGRDAGKPVGVCGESASDPAMALVLAGLGVTSLSMAAAAVPSVRFALARHTLATCRAVASAALAQTSAQGAREAALENVDPEVRDALGLG